jgi:ribosomal protein S18 acetylase RimI-like enzyme
MMQIAIRPATAHNLDELNEIIEEVDALHRKQMPHILQKPHGSPRDREYMLELLADESHGIFIAEAGGELLGFVQVAIRDTPPIPILVPRRFAAVENLVVSSASRRMGIGRALMHRVERWAEEKGATEIELNVYEFNQSAFSFYRSLGYVTTSRKMEKRLS